MYLLHEKSHVKPDDLNIQIRQSPSIYTPALCSTVLLPDQKGTLSFSNSPDQESKV